MSGRVVLGFLKARNVVMYNKFENFGITRTTMGL
jgi:hypothetical protein